MIINSIWKIMFLCILPGEKNIQKLVVHVVYCTLWQLINLKVLRECIQ